MDRHTKARQNTYLLWPRLIFSGVPFRCLLRMMRYVPLALAHLLGGMGGPGRLSHCRHSCVVMMVFELDVVMLLPDDRGTLILAVLLHMS